jgi:hypothetical protein
MAGDVMDSMVQRNNLHSRLTRGYPLESGIAEQTNAPSSTSGGEEWGKTIQRFFLNSSEMEWIETAIDTGISYRNKKDALKLVKDWDDFHDVLYKKNPYCYFSETHFILSTSYIIFDPELDPEFE